MTRSTSGEVTFRHAFTLKGVDRLVPAGTYQVEIEEEAIEGLSFVAHRRLATFIRLPMAGHGAGSSQTFLVTRQDLEAALERDAAREGG